MFDPAIDHAGWPGPLGARAAVFGEAWVGTRGLLGWLETVLGLGGRFASEPERACQLARELEGKGGFWSRSFEADRVGTCRRLLRDRDMLAMWGWCGEQVSPRLAALAEATRGALPGVPDRLRAIAEALRDGAHGIERITIMGSVAELPPLWRRVFELLGERGAAIHEAAPALVPARGDLEAARATKFEPRGDGSLVLLRPHGPLAAADEVAGALAAADTLHGVVIIGADSTLDRALARCGLPRVGAGAPAPGSAALVRLVLEAAFEPADAADVYALVIAAPGPVPQGLGARLARALASFPGRRSQEWDEAMRAGLAKLDDERRLLVEQRVAALVMPAGRRNEPLPTAELTNRLRALEAWARGRVEREPTLAGALAASVACRRLLDDIGAPALTHTAVRRLCDEIDSAAALVAPAEAGLAHVGHPGGVLGPARVVVWWNFTRASAGAAPRLRLSTSERAGLAAAGVTPPDFGAAMEHEARRWRRPLELASEALILVCPRTDDAGERSFPHPLWDELTATMARPSLAATLERRELSLPAAPRRRRVDLRPLPVAADTARAGRALALREPESASSLERLLGCSLAWTLRYPARLYSGRSSGPEQPTPLLYGIMAHHVLARVFVAGSATPDEAARRAEALVDAELDGTCETLALPRYQVERATVRRAIVDTARALAELIASSGATLHGVEQAGDRDVSGLRLAGTADVVLHDPDAVIDLKWGKTGPRDKLACGAALQLAVYAQVHKRGRRLPSVAYLSLTSQDLMTEPDSALPGGWAPGEADASAMWCGALAALEDRRAELAGGVLAAPGVRDEVVEEGLAGGRLTIAPPCTYCEHGALCGVGVGR